MTDTKELAYRYDLFITPEWQDRFDSLVDESVNLPEEGRILHVNCGTGAYAIEVAERMKGKGEVVGVDPSEERLLLARAKAQVAKVKHVSFERCSAAELHFPTDEFAAVIGDASLVPSYEVEDVLSEMMRVAQPTARVVLKLATHGSFDEFFSIFWEALFGLGLAQENWNQLEVLINQRITVSDAELMAERAGMENVESFSSKEEFFFETGAEFFESPLIKDIFLEDWLEIVPQSRRDEVLERMISIIDEERHSLPFEVSIKATLISGTKAS